MGEFPGKLGISWQEFIDMGRENPGSNEKFSMSVFALNTCQEANGVSWLHGKVSQRMFAPVWKGYFPDELHVGYVTNGVHMPTWASTEWKRFFAEHFDKKFFKDQSNKKYWEAIQNVADEEIWSIRKTLKNKLITYIKNQYKTNWLKTKEILQRLSPSGQINRTPADRFRPPFRNLQTCPPAVHRPGPSGQDRKQRTISDPVRIHR